MRLTTTLMLLAALALVGCSSTTSSAGGERAQTVKAEKPFAAGGSIELQLGGGDYVVRAASDDRVRVSIGGNAGNTDTDVTTDGTHARVTVSDTPHNDFHSTIEVPKTADLVVHLTGGNLAIETIAGNKEIESKAGNVSIAVSNPDDYASVNASVTVGDLNAGPFGGSRSGLSPRLAWSGPGKYTLRASLGAGNLEFRK